MGNAVDEYMARFGHKNGKTMPTKPLARLYIYDVFQPPGCTAKQGNVYVKIGVANDLLTQQQIANGDGFAKPLASENGRYEISHSNFEHLLSMCNMDGDRPVFLGRLNGATTGLADIHSIRRTDIPFDEYKHNINTGRCRYVHNKLIQDPVNGQDNDDRLRRRQYELVGTDEGYHIGDPPLSMELDVPNNTGIIRTTGQFCL